MMSEEKRMTKEQIKSIMKKEVIRKGYVYKECDSKSTGSFYFTISCGLESLHFRISDHATKKNIITIRTDKKMTEQSLRGFINNRIDGLRRRVLNEFFR